MSWEILDEDALTKIKKQKDFEDQTAKKLTPLYESAQNPIIKLFIRSIILDTSARFDMLRFLKYGLYAFFAVVFVSVR